jgi:hypothetical protein
MLLEKVAPEEFVLTLEEEKLMDLLVSHFVDFYFESPQKFLEPVLQVLPRKITNKKGRNGK